MGKEARKRRIKRVSKTFLSDDDDGRRIGSDWFHYRVCVFCLLNSSENSSAAPSILHFGEAQKDNVRSKIKY